MNPERPLQHPDGWDRLHAVAVLAIELSIASRNRILYGPDHPAARGGAATVLARAEAAFAAGGAFEIHVTRTTLLSGNQYLDRKNPIFRQLAALLWSLGFVALRFEPGLTEREVSDLLALVAEARRARLGPAEAARRLPALGLVHLRVRSVRDLLEFHEAVELAPASRAERDRQLEEQLFRLESEIRIPGPAAGEPASRAVARLARQLGDADRRHAETDYATAMVSYLRAVDGAHGRSGLAVDPNLRRRLADLLERLGPSLRQQVLTAGLEADLSPATTTDLVRLFDQGALVAALSKLGAEGRSLPATSYRVLSMLALLEGGPGAADETPLDDEEEALADQEGERWQGVLDGLLSPEDRIGYLSPEYEQRLESLSSDPSDLPLPAADSAPPPRFDEAETDLHFLLVGASLAKDEPDDPPLAAGLWRGYAATTRSAAGRGDWETVRRAIVAARDLRRHAPSLAAVAGPWETPEGLDLLRKELESPHRDRALGAALALAACGLPAFDRLLGILGESPDRSIRHLALDALVHLDDDPAPRIVEVLEGKPPWFLARNLLYVLRRRRSPELRRAADIAWPDADPRVRIELIRGLFALRDPSWLALFRAMVAEGSRAQVLGAARLLARVRWHEVIEPVIARVERLRPWEIASDFHLELLRRLVESRNRSARAFVAAVPLRARVVFPGQRGRLRREVARLLREVPP